MEHLNEILAKHFSKETLSTEEGKILDNWIRENETEYAALKASWNQPLPNYPNFDAKVAWEKVDAQLNPPKTQSKQYFTWLSLAAVIIVLLGSYFFLNSTGPVTIANNSSTKLEHILPDGSTVFIARESQISYEKNFSNNRTLKLKGEAFFEVERDKTRPFVVKHKFGEVEVLGTGFDVKVESNSTLVAVSHGAVACRNNKGMEQTLTKGESAAISDSYDIDYRQHTAVNTFSWKTGKFKFDNDNIEKVINDLNTFYDKKIKLAPGVSTDEFPSLTATFDNQSFEEIIDIISVTCQVNFDIQENFVLLTH